MAIPLQNVLLNRYSYWDLAYENTHHGRFAFSRTLVSVPGQLLSTPFPNHIVLNMESGESGVDPWGRVLQHFVLKFLCGPAVLQTYKGISISFSGLTGLQATEGLDGGLQL